MNRRLDALRKKEKAARDVVIRVARVGPEFIQIHVSAFSSDRWLKLTDTEARKLAEDILRELGGGSDG